MAVPCAVSVASHLVVIYAASRIAWRADETGTPHQAYRVVWLSEGLARSALEAESIVDMEAAVVVNAAPTAPTAPVESAPAAPPAFAETTPTAPAEDGDRNASAPEDTRSPPPTATPRAVLSPQIDWEGERRRAIERAREQREREEAYSTFSSNDVIEKALPQEAEPSMSVFDSPAAGRAGISYRDASGATVTWISDACSSVTGGIGNIFAFPDSLVAANLPIVACVRLIPRDDLFEHLKPRYLRVRPRELAASPESQLLSDLDAG